MTEETKKVIHEIIESNFYFDRVPHENGVDYRTEIYLDYREKELPESLLNRILSAKNPQDAFYEELFEIFMESEMYEYDYFVDQFMEYFDGTQEEVDKDEVVEYLYDIVHFDIPFKTFLQQDVNINIAFDFYNESNTDFTCNSFYLNGIQYVEKLEKGSITWLVNSQGYTMKEFYDVFHGKKKTDSKFLNSLVDELEMNTYSMSLLTICTQMELGDVLDWYEKKTPLSFDTSSNIGLYNPWQGCGGMFEIALEKPITVQPKNIYSLATDGALGYSIREIYGTDSSFWR